MIVFYYVTSKNIYEVRDLKNKIIMLISILTLLTLIGCSNSNVITNSKSNNKIVNENDIVSLKIINITEEKKEIKDKADIAKIIKMINDTKIIKTDAKAPIGGGYGVEITYSNDKTERIGFMSSNSSYTMVYNNKCYEIDKDISNELHMLFC